MIDSPPPGSAGRRPPGPGEGADQPGHDRPGRDRPEHDRPAEQHDEESSAAHPGRSPEDPQRYESEPYPPVPPPYPAEPGRSRHETAGPAGYPQSAGPGAARSGSEPVEPPPPVAGAVPPPPVTGYYPAQPAGGHVPPPPVSGQTGRPDPYGPAPIPPPGAAPPQYGPPGTGPQTYGAGPTDTAAQQEWQQPGWTGEPQGWGPPPGNVAAPGAVPRQGPPGYPPVPAEYSVGHALGFGWDRFRANSIPWIAVTLVGFAVALVITMVVNIASVNSLLPVVLLALVSCVAFWLLQAAMIRGALYETDGTPPDFQKFFGFLNAGNVLLTALIVLVVVTVGWLLVIPALIVGWLCMFSLHFVIDQDQGPFTAIRSSVRLVISHWASTLLLAVSVAVMTAVGVLLCGVGLVVVGPVTAIAVTYTYRYFTSGLA